MTIEICLIIRRERIQKVTEILYEEAQEQDINGVFIKPTEIFMCEHINRGDYCEADCRSDGIIKVKKCFHCISIELDRSIAGNRDQQVIREHYT